MRLATLFDALEAERRKEQGMAAAASLPFRKALLAIAQSHALRIAHERSEVTSDDVYAAMEMESPGSWTALGNAAGSVFRHPGLRFSGRYAQSRRPSSHARMVKVWEASR